MSSDDWQHLFTQFWEVAERKIAAGQWPPEPLVHVRENWQRWWRKILSPDERRQVERLAEAARADASVQESFARWLKEWIDERFKRGGAGRLVLVQLAQTSPFSTWPGWGCYRTGVGALILTQPSCGRWSTDDLRPLIVVAVHKERVADPPYYQINLDINEEGALRRARDASLSALRGVVFWVFLALWVICGRKNSPARVWKALGICWMLAGLGWAVVWGLLMFLSTSDLFAYFPDELLLVPTLSALVAFPLLGLLYILLYEGGRAYLRGRELAEQLKEHQLYLLIGNREAGQTLRVKGRSFSWMLAHGNLTALYEAKPFSKRPSWLLQQCFEGMAGRLPRLSGTGDITSLGWNSRVERLEDKIEVSRAHPDIEEMSAPLQKEARLPRRWRAQPTSAPAESVGHAAGAGTLRLRRCCHLSWAMLTVGNLVSLRSVLASMVMLFASLAAVYNLPDVVSIAGASAPALVHHQVIIPDPRLRPDERFLTIMFRTDSPEAFEVYEHYQHRTAKLRPSPNNPLYAVASIKLNSRRPTPPSSVMIELRQHRRLLGFDLPDKTVLTRTIP